MPAFVELALQSGEMTLNIVNKFYSYVDDAKCWREKPCQLGGSGCGNRTTGHRVAGVRERARQTPWGRSERRLRGARAWHVAGAESSGQTVVGGGTERQLGPSHIRPCQLVGGLGFTGKRGAVAGGGLSRHTGSGQIWKKNSDPPPVATSPGEQPLSHNNPARKPPAISQPRRKLDGYL